MASEDVQATIHQAIESARYNEAVIVSVSDEGNNSREIVLVACLDREHGGIVWRDASIKSSDPNVTNNEDVGIIRHLRTKLWAVPMLNDSVRNDMYNRAVRDACRKAVQKRIQDPDNDGVIRILDIGSGTGLIAMMATKHCKDAIVEAKKMHPECKSTKVQVTSCEMASAMARLARLTIDENKSILHDSNGIDCGIVVVECHSTDSGFSIQDGRFEDRQQQVLTEPKKADVCTSELLDSGLLGEGVLPSLRDAFERHLKPDAVVIPVVARVVAVLVEGCPRNETSSHKKTLNGATAFYGPDLQVFEFASGGVWLATTPKASKSASGHGSGILLGVLNNSSGSASQGINIPLHAEAILEHHGKFHTVLANPLQEYDEYPLARDVTAANDNDNTNTLEITSNVGIRPLSTPKTVLNIDFASDISSFPPSDIQTIPTTFVPTENGIVDGVLFWWELDLDSGATSTYSTEPIGCFKTDHSKKMHWQDHWQQCLFLFGDTERKREVKAGNKVEVNVSHSDYCVYFSINGINVANETKPATKRKLNDGTPDISEQETFNRHISPARALQLNDNHRTSVLRDAVLYALKTKGTDASVLDLSDMGICAMIAAAAGKAKFVTSLESNSAATLAATVAQLGNSLPREGMVFQVIQALSEKVTKDYIVQGQAEIVVAEPYYQMLEGWHIQESLNYYYLVQSFRARGLISETAVSVPTVACIMACVVEFQDFSNAYGPVGGDCEEVNGFQHKTVNRYGNRYHTYDSSLPLWQYRCKRLTDPCCVAKINYEGDAGIEDDYWTTAKFMRSGIADTVVFWVDYLCRSTVGTHTKTSTNERFNVISTSSCSHRQTIRKLLSSVSVSDEDMKHGKLFRCRSKFSAEDSECDHCFSYEFVDECIGSN